MATDSNSAAAQGSAGLLICFGLIGIMMFNVVYALGELATVFPISGGFYTYSTRFIDPSWGFAMGWNYVMQWCAVLPLEIVVAGLSVQYWDTTTSNAVWVTIFLFAIIFINVSIFRIVIHILTWKLIVVDLWCLGLWRRRVLVISTKAFGDRDLHYHRHCPSLRRRSIQWRI